MARRTGRSLWFGMWVAFAAAALCPSAEARSSRDSRTRKETKRYVVIQARGTDGVIVFEVIESDRVREREKQAKDDFVGAAKEWMADRKDAKKHGEAFDQPKPTPPLVRKIGKTFSNKEDAEEFRSKIETLWDKKMEAKKKKEEAKDDDGDDDEKRKKPKKKLDDDDDDGEKKDAKKDKDKGKEKAKKK